MPLKMPKASPGSRNRTHRDDPSASLYTDFPQGYPPGDPPETVDRSPHVLRRSGTKRKEPVFTTLPSHTPTDAGDYADFVRVDNPDAVMRGALNARPVEMPDPTFPPLDGPLSEALSEREPEGGLHGTPRLPPQIQRTGSFHSVRGDRVNPNEPIIMNSSPTRSSGSDRTTEASHTSSLPHPNDRVIPPLPRNYSGGYGAGSRSPADIYNSHHFDVVHEPYEHHNGEIYLERHRRGGYEKGSPLFYIIPGGINVIFQDERGSEITRVGDFSGRTQPSRPGPFVVKDEHGRELYRYDGYRRTHRGGYTDPQIVQIDSPNNSSYHRRDKNYPSYSYRPGPSYKRGYDHHRDHHDYRDKDQHNHQDYRYRGYADYPRYDSEYRGHGAHGNHESYRDHHDEGYRDYYGGYHDRPYKEYSDHYPSHHNSEYRDRRGHRNYHEGYPNHYERYKPYREYTTKEVPEIQPPGRVSSRASHRSHTHGSQLPIDRMPHQHTGSIPDDRRSTRDYAPSRASVRHDEDGVGITGGIEALRI